MNYATTLSRVAALCLLAGAAHASPVVVSPAAADAGIAVPATVYSPALPARPAAAEAASPDRAWREQNRIVAGYNPMMLTMAAHGAAAHAGHAAPAADPHAGHTMAQHGAQAGHGAAAATSAPAADPHAGHRMPAAQAMDGKAAPMSAGGCCKDGCCCKGAAGAGHAGMQGCCAKGGADAPQSCAPAHPAPGAPGAPPHPKHHGGQP